MTLRNQGKRWYGDDHQDLREELSRYALCGDYPIDNFVDVNCRCGCQQFKLFTDEDAGIAVRKCVGCQSEHLMGDSAEFADGAEVGQHECLCGTEVFQISVGIHRYREHEGLISDDVRWLYIGCRCVACGLLGCYADWKSEFQGFHELLSNM
jgi:hypothetical protein